MKFEKSNLQPIPQPRFKLPFLGHLHYLKNGIQEGFIEFTEKLGPIYRLKLGPHNMIVVAGLEFLRELGNDTKFTKYLGPAAKDLRKAFSGGFGFLSTDDPAWKKINRLILPGFQQKAIEENYFPIMKSVLTKMFSKWDNAPEKNKINLNSELGRLVLDTVGLCEFRYDFRSIFLDKPHPLPEAIDKIFLLSIKRMVLPEFVDKLFFRQRKEFQHTLAILHKYSDEILEARRKSSNSTPDYKDFLHLLMYEAERATGEKFDDKFLMSQIYVLLFASIGSSTSLLVVSFYALMTHPEVLEKAYKEIDNVLGTDPNKPITVGNFARLVYIRQILNESLRLWQPVAFIERTPIEDIILQEKYLIKKGEGVSAIVSFVHHDKALWGEDADSFNPDRFAPMLHAKRDPYAFLPFGFGLRACIGRQFALFQSTVILTLILHKYRLHLKSDKIDNAKVRMDNLPALWVTLEKRNMLSL